MSADYFFTEWQRTTNYKCCQTKNSALKKNSASKKSPWDEFFEIPSCGITMML